ncbi:MalY/PatB family protein [Clostridium sp. AM58-1XD]|uniref:MalY/PatB family protein n=1 Tax=Clostridium sp. AM58-1XD TaxID=2292307 RepID=UPI000E4DFC9C|nr:MalY/PatB family protein [Clostridium sp. AM58-1XD]RGY97938.1 pyridoxal phosphate-dependent aminotransferase [Clostridium sp. AM58-1XD]
MRINQEGGPCAERSSYHFEELKERRGTGSMKWDVPEGELPMWVADMDFEAAPEIKEAIRKRAEHGIFGYTVVPDTWREAVAGWWKRRHGYEMENGWLIFATGVVPAISSAVRKFTTAGENVLVQTPVYNIFFNSIRNNGRNVLENRLLYDGRTYRIDWEDLERKLRDPQTSMMLLCNPHNPTGMIWTREELERIGKLCAANHVKVLSDEIHCDLTEPGYDYMPFAAVSEECAQNSITCIAPTKAFNLAGLQTAAVMVPNEDLRHKMDRALNTDEAAEPNTFAIDAAVAAFTKGDGWLDALREYLAENRKTVRSFLESEIPNVTFVPSHATYLLWLDCRGIMGNAAELGRYLRSETGLYLSSGTVYGGNGDDFLRMNIACPRERLLDGLKRLKNGIKSYEEYLMEQC